MPYEVYTTNDLDRKTGKLSQEEQKRIQKIFVQLRNNPHVGDQLQIKILREKRLREKRLREKRLREKRIYYLVFYELNAVLVVAISDKKAQQKTIGHIIKYVNEYRDYLKELLKCRD